MAGNFTNFPTALVPTLQTGFLEREFEEGLDSILGYRRVALRETVPARLGETITRTRKGRKAPVTTPLSPQATQSLDNGMTPASFAVEQYLLSMFSYGDTVDVNLLQELAGIADQMIADSRNNGVQAAQSMDRLARSSLFGAYIGGNTRVRTDLGASSTTTCHVDDIRGFTQVLVNGVPTPISGSNPISVVEAAIASGGVNQTLSVTGAAADATNNSMMLDGVSGILTFTSATSPVNGDSLIAANAAKILRPLGKTTTAQLVGSDVFTLGLAQDAATALKNNAVPPMPDGTYHVLYDSTSERQLFADQDFKIYFAGRAQLDEIRTGNVIEMLGLKFIPITEAYVQPPQQEYNGTTYDQASTATGAAAVNVTVRRPLVVGGGALIQGDFEGLDRYMAREGMNAISEIFMVNGIAHILRPPLDRLGQWASLTWNWIGGFAVPTDLTATPSIIPTASSALYKRAVAIEHAG